MVPIHVETSTGDTAFDRSDPQAFWVGSIRFSVMEVEDRWFGEGYRYVKVFADDSGHHILRQDHERGAWFLLANSVKQ